MVFKVVLSVVVMIVHIDLLIFQKVSHCCNSTKGREAGSANKYKTKYNNYHYKIWNTDHANRSSRH